MWVPASVSRSADAEPYAITSDQFTDVFRSRHAFTNYGFSYAANSAGTHTSAISTGSCAYIFSDDTHRIAFRASCASEPHWDRALRNIRRDSKDHWLYALKRKRPVPERSGVHCTHMSDCLVCVHPHWRIGPQLVHHDSRHGNAFQHGSSCAWANGPADRKRLGIFVDRAVGQHAGNRAHAVLRRGQLGLTGHHWIHDAFRKRTV